MSSHYEEIYIENNYLVNLSFLLPTQSKNKPILSSTVIFESVNFSSTLNYLYYTKNFRAIGRPEISNVYVTLRASHAFNWNTDNQSICPSITNFFVESSACITYQWYVRIKRFVTGGILHVNAINKNHAGNVVSFITRIPI